MPVRELVATRRSWWWSVWCARPRGWCWTRRWRCRQGSAWSVWGTGNRWDLIEKELTLVYVNMRDLSKTEELEIGQNSMIKWVWCTETYSTCHLGEIISLQKPAGRVTITKVRYWLVWFCLLNSNCDNKTWMAVNTVAKLIVLEWGVKVNSDIVLSHRPARINIGWRAGTTTLWVNYSISPKSGTMNMATCSC